MLKRISYLVKLLCLQMYILFAVFADFYAFSDKEKGPAVCGAFPYSLRSCAYACSGFRPRISLASAGVATSRFISLASWTTLSTISPLDLARTPLDM